MKNLANPNNVRILTYNKKIKVMTVEKITEKWGIPKFMVEDQKDILRI